ncbi:uracil-DNA glycosylase family protein [Clostridium chrysemydis]|uniref:uracil-DNA glycosylase family protein n=1 Tax=Clostridium chrysemydis TaxID=2665504 RepID=UPI003F39DF18
MLERIKQCKNCSLCINQEPLLDKESSCEVMWIGLSAKKVEDIECDIPLSKETNSGEVLYEIESMCKDIGTYKTNLVKCLPLDENKKLRYPNRKEIDSCFENIINEINTLKPKLIFLLGTQVTTSIERNLKIKLIKDDNNIKVGQYNETKVVSVYHPSYVCSYKRKYRGEYIQQITSIINEELKVNNKEYCEV